MIGVDPSGPSKPDRQQQRRRRRCLRVPNGEGGGWEEAIASARKAAELGITAIVFDRGGYLYHGRVKSVADGAREGGLQF